jgi:hypothetical protein
MSGSNFPRITILIMFVYVGMMGEYMSGHMSKIMKGICAMMFLAQKEDILQNTIFQKLIEFAW